jgi:DNA segregation ATPase FtsK/SpoIIIE, S-DNA-T family
MQLILLKKNAIYSCALPEKTSGQFWVTQHNDDGQVEKVISVEGFEGKWLLKSNSNASILGGDNQKVKELVLEPLCFYSIYLKNSDERVLLYSEPITNDRRTFEKLKYPAEGKLTIGRDKDCDISYSNIYTSLKHAEIEITEKEIKIVDLDSSNGIYINGLRVKNAVLSPGDVIYIMGLKIIISKGFLAVNNPDGKVAYNSTLLRRFSKQKVEPAEDEDYSTDETGSKGLFYRSPRFKRDLEKIEIKIDAPPPLGNVEETPLMLMLGPSITMGMTSLFTGLLTLQNVMRTNGDIMTSMPTLMMSFSMLLGTIMWPILTKRHEKKKRMQREALRQEKYIRYISEILKKIEDERDHQKRILHENHPSLEECILRIKHRQRNLWERTLGQTDFLKARLGIGTLPLEADIKYPEKRFSLEEDSLLKELYDLADEPKLLEQVPITLSFTEALVSGIIGRRSRVTDFVKGLIMQLAALHSYDEVKFVFIYDSREQDKWEFVKWLPHVWNNEKSVRFVAANQSEVKELSAFFEKEIAKREAVTVQDELKETGPHYMVFAVSRDLAGKAEMVNSILKHKKNYGFSLITLYDELRNLPKECSMVVELEDNEAKIYDKNDISGEHIAFKPDIFLKEEAENLAVELANIQLDSSVSSYILPNMLTFMEMFGVGKIEHLNAMTRWKENDPTITLEAPIGVNASGELFKLDLHEKFHGPHGLVAGMTGSGKSEFIITFILSLAVNYHPHEVAFILIDYKGGGMANAFTDLPHLAGTITNLDGAAVKRSLVSIQSELKRRQSIFSETSKKVNVSNIDIYKYQKLYRDGAVKEPLQHLFIISDEFAELKTQQPEFMEQLVSAARIGRSLGVHLILATQKPSGVVDDQIWSNSRFRICLKVQEKADSMDVIKRPDAAELSVTGRYYVQVGFNELFELGQSAWSGAPYYPSDRAEKKKDDTVMVIDNLGRIIKQAKIDKRKSITQNPPKQLDEINKYLAKLAKEENISVRPLWLDPIPESIYLQELKQKYAAEEAERRVLNPVIGEVDDPANQRQLLMRLPLTKEGNAVIYGAAGNGKTTFLTTLVYSLMEDHTPSELNLYILDFGSETLRAFSKAPHVGDVLLSHEAEKVNNLIKMFYKEIEKRKKLFSDYGGDYQSYMGAGKTDIASIAVIIHNYSAFAETYEDKEEAISYLTREGLKYGIYFVVTALSTGALRYRILQNFKQLYVLQLNDTSDYSGVLGNVDGVYPSKYKGRGIFKTDRVYEFQTAKICKDSENTFEYVRSYSEQYSKKWTKASARKIPILPEKIDAYYLAGELHNSADKELPIGIEKNSLNISYYDFESSYINMVLSQENKNADFAQGLAEIITAKGTSEVLVVDPENKFSLDEEKNYNIFRSDEELDRAVVELFNTLVHRNNSYKDAKGRGEDIPPFDKIICIINSLSSLMSKLSEDRKDKLKVFLEKGETAYNINFIICDSVSSILPYSYENWFKAKVSLSDGIWIGNGIADQYALKISNINNELYQDIGESLGYKVSKGKARLIKLISSVSVSREVELDG